MRRSGPMLAWGLWAGLLAVLAHALGGSPVSTLAWVAVPAGAAAIFWLVAQARLGRWGILIAFVGVQALGHILLQSLHVSHVGHVMTVGTTAGHVHGTAPVAPVSATPDWPSLMIAMHAAAAIACVVWAVLFGPASRCLISATPLLAAPASIPARPAPTSPVSSVVVLSTQFLIGSLRGRAPPVAV